LILSLCFSFSGSLIIEIEKNVATIEGYGQYLQAGIPRIYATPGAHIELPMVRGTAERFSRQAALAQAALLVGTSIRICVNVVVYIDQQNSVPIYVQTHHFAAPKVVY
jgi:hypothetical protein